MLRETYTNLHSKGKMVSIPVISVSPAYLVQHVVFCDLPTVLTAISYSRSGVSLMMQMKILKFKAPQNRNPFDC
jgi:hypothetical protein